MALFQFGLGYTTSGLARQAQQQQQWRIVSTARNPEKYSTLASEQHKKQHQVLPFNPAAGGELLSARGRDALLQSRYVVTCIPPIASTMYDPVLQTQLKLLREACNSSSCQIQGLGYLSSTGVYGDWQGQWVDESCEPRAATSRGVVRLEAELAWAALAEQIGVPLTIFRLGGIYGPRRSVLDNLKAQLPPRSSTARRTRQRYTSRCHVTDVVSAVLADMQRRCRQPGTSAATGSRTGSDSLSSSSSGLIDIINVVDDEPAPRSEVEAYARQLLLQHTGPLPPAKQDTATQTASGNTDGSTSKVVEAAGSSSRRSKQEPLEEKRVRNDRLKAVLQVQLKAPSFREGLEMIHAGDTQPFADSDLDCLYGP